MKCYNHEERDSVATCVTCGKGLCKECATVFNMPQCTDCVKADLEMDKQTFYKTIGTSIVLFIIGFLFTKDMGQAFFVACVPYGWSLINRFTPAMFLSLSGIGWMIYIGVKLCFAIMIGVIAFPYTIIKAVIKFKKTIDFEKQVKNI